MRPARVERDGRGEPQDALARRLAQDDESVLREILAAWGSAVDGMLKRRFYPSIRRDEFADVKNESLMRLWQLRGRAVRSDHLLRLRFRRIATNVALQRVASKWARARRRELQLDPADLERLLTAGDKGTRHGLAPVGHDKKWIAKLRGAVRKACRALPEIQRRIVCQDLRSRHGEANRKELARELQLSPLQLRKYRQRAYESLRTILRQYDPQHGGEGRRKRGGPRTG